MKQLHQIQREILYRLLFSNGLRYSEVKPSKELENNQFDFHLDQLIKLDFVEHIKSLYSLTNKGKDYTNRIDSQEKTLNNQAKLGVLICAIRGIKDGSQFLIYTRMKQPFYGCQGFMTGKIKYGETVLDTAKRELFEETNLKGDPQLVSVIHYRVFEKASKELREDKFMFFCLILDPIGEIIPNNEGKFEWISKQDLARKVIKHFANSEDFYSHISLAENFDGTITFKEIDSFTENY